MTLEEVIALQHRLGLTDVHVVFLGPESFQLAHTTMERDMKQALSFNLAECLVHRWLNGVGKPPAPIGLYTITPHKHDGYSDSFRSDAEPWELHRLDGVN